MSTHIGFAINEILFLAALVTGACWVAWKLRLRRSAGAAALAKPWWVTFGAELFAVAALMCTCRVAVADWPKVPSGSMEPTLRVGDYLLVNHLAYGPRLPFTNTAIPFGRPQRGDVVVFRYPLDVSQFYVKRLIGMPGDVVSFRDGVVAINGAPFDSLVIDANVETGPLEDHGDMLLRETAAAAPHVLKINPFVRGTMPLNLQQPALAAQCKTERPGAWQCTVPAGHYMMLGDNRDNSSDSRYWGFLPEREVYGKAVRVLFNLSDMKRAWSPL